VPHARGLQAPLQPQMFLEPRSTGPALGDVAESGATALNFSREPLARPQPHLRGGIPGTSGTVAGRHTHSPTRTLTCNVHTPGRRLHGWTRRGLSSAITLPSPSALGSGELLPGPGAGRAPPAGANRYRASSHAGGRRAGPAAPLHPSPRLQQAAGRGRLACAPPHSPLRHHCRPPIPPCSCTVHRGARQPARRLGTLDAERGCGTRGGLALIGGAGPRRARTHTRARTHAGGPGADPAGWAGEEGEGRQRRCGP
jgi:hypothetical protein